MIVYRELFSLEQDLGICAKTLYAVSNNPGKHYHNIQIPKKNGGYRGLSVPDEVLKTIQKRITDVILIHMPVSQYINKTNSINNVGVEKQVSPQPKVEFVF